MAELDMRELYGSASIRSRLQEKFHGNRIRIASGGVKQNEVKQNRRITTPSSIQTPQKRNHRGSIPLPFNFPNAI
ncbi:MAG: hypothetical protein LBS40_09305 [Burkholderiales bacterium]|nr:hypothetical protein [Burkholderiales bacterium]